MLRIVDRIVEAFAVAALIYGLSIRKDLNLSRVYRIAATTVRQTSVVMMIIAGSAVLDQFLANEQIPQRIASGLGGLTDSFVLRMLLINVFLLFLGMFLHASAWFILAMFVTLMIVAFTPWTAPALR